MKPKSQKKGGKKKKKKKRKKEIKESWTPGLLNEKKLLGRPS